VSDLHTIARELQNKGVDLVVTEQNIDTTTPTGRLMFNMLGAIAEFETDLRRERQLEGIAKAKAEGRYTGRPFTVDGVAIRAALAVGEYGLLPSTPALGLREGRALKTNLLRF